MDNIFELNENNFLVGISDLEQFRYSPQRVDHLLILFCIQGNATLMLNVIQYQFSPAMPWVILPGNMLSLVTKSENFKAHYCYVNKRCFHEVTLRVSHKFFEFVQNDPPDRRSDDAVNYINYFFEMITRLQNDKNHFFREEIFKNYLQNYLYELYDKTRQFYALQQKKNYNQPDILFKQFMTLIKKNYKSYHNVQFYADEMCITARYLFQITRKIAHCSPKKVIYDYMILEIKQRLKNTTRSIQEIADDLGFNDQFTMGRVFKQYTAMTPTEYRKS